MAMVFFKKYLPLSHSTILKATRDRLPVKELGADSLMVVRDRSREDEEAVLVCNECDHESIPKAPLYSHFVFR